MVKKVITNLDLSKVLTVFRWWFWRTVGLNWNLTNVWRSLVFQIFGSFHWWSLYLRMLEKKRSTAKNNCPVSLLSLLSKVFEKLANNRIFGHLENFGLFCDFQYGFRSSRSTADLLAVVSDRIARAFNRSGNTQDLALDISKAFDSVWYTGLLHKLKSYGISGQIFGLISSFCSNAWYWISSQCWSSLRLHSWSYNFPTDLPGDIICDIAVYADDTTLCSKCGQASDLWQQLELASELEFDLRDTVNCGRKWLVDFDAGKTQLISFDQSNNTGAIDVNMDGSVLEKKLSFEMVEFLHW